jgi:gas vesicle protein
MSTGKIVLGVLAGAAVGALIGILFAPEKGSVTRRKISKKGEDYVGSVKDKFTEIFENFTEQFEQVKDEMSDVVEPKREKQ